MDFGETRFFKRLAMRYGENPGYPAAFISRKKALRPEHGHPGDPPGGEAKA